MRLQNNITGDILECPPPDELGASVVRLNGRVIERVLYSDLDGGSVTLGDGRIFKDDQEFAAYIVARLAQGEAK